jgi:hypothetical protein
MWSCTERVVRAPQDLDRLGQPGLAHRRRVERDAGRLVLGEPVAGPDAELDPPAGDPVERRQLAGQVHRVVEVVVEHQRAHPQPLGRLGGGLEDGQRRPLAGHHVVPHAEDVEAGGLGVAREAAQLAGRRHTRRQLEPESERCHAGHANQPATARLLINA